MSLRLVSICGILLICPAYGKVVGSMGVGFFFEPRSSVVGEDEEFTHAGIRGQTGSEPPEREKSTGPKTERGKERSSLNAVTHGCRAETLILRDEEPAELEARRQAWIASLEPRDETERRAVEDAVVYSWRQDRARRAEVALANARIAEHGAGNETTVKEQVIELGRRLFLDRLGPIEFYPTGIREPELPIREPTTSFTDDQRQDPNEPAILILRLQSTLEGCEWLLGEWAKLKRALDRGQPWLSSDKLKAVRLLGKQPVDAIDDEDVALVFLASCVLKPDRRKWHWEISLELNERDTERFENDAASRQLESLLKPADASAAREALATLIERVTKPLAAKAEAHRQRASIKTALAADLFAFDPSVEAERLRRHELACGRAMARSLDTLFKLRRATPSAVSAPLSAVRGMAESMTEAIGPNEPAGWENAPNEPTAAENSPNEPIAGWENSPNEPTVAAFHEGDTSRQWAAGANSDREGEVGRGQSTDGGEAVKTVASEEPDELFEEALLRIRRRREEHTRQLNEQAKKEAADARAARAHGDPGTRKRRANPDTNPAATGTDRDETKKSNGRVRDIGPGGTDASLAYLGRLARAPARNCGLNRAGRLRTINNGQRTTGNLRAF